MKSFAYFDIFDHLCCLFLINFTLRIHH